MSVNRCEEGPRPPLLKEGYPDPTGFSFSPRQVRFRYYSMGFDPGFTREGGLVRGTGGTGPCHGGTSGWNSLSSFRPNHSVRKNYYLYRDHFNKCISDMCRSWYLNLLTLFRPHPVPLAELRPSSSFAPSTPGPSGGVPSLVFPRT